ncbi:MAG: hypothetical protein C4519_24260 [Desulfobacteraceae bacterium]|nr:MAG: hypothetical protein C4519_24260 [Desulfobacteraceae bacterium]
MYYLKAKVENGKLHLPNSLYLKGILKFYEGKEISIEIKKYRKTRTTQQNKALHLWFTQLANELNDNGCDMRQVISQAVDIPWSPYTIKEHLFRPTMKTMFGYKSTRLLKTNEIDKIFDVISKAIGERTGLFIPFPSVETLMQEELEN